MEIVVNGKRFQVVERLFTDMFINGVRVAIISSINNGGGHKEFTVQILMQPIAEGYFSTLAQRFPDFMSAVEAVYERMEAR